MTEPRSTTTIPQEPLQPPQEWTEGSWITGSWDAGTEQCGWHATSRPCSGGVLLYPSAAKAHFARVPQSLQKGLRRRKGPVVDEEHKVEKIVNTAAEKELEDANLNTNEFRRWDGPPPSKSGAQGKQQQRVPTSSSTPASSPSVDLSGTSASAVAEPAPASYVSEWQTPKRRIGGVGSHVAVREARMGRTPASIGSTKKTINSTSWR